MKNRKLLLIASLLLALAMSLGGTLAYLTDTDEAVNVMTLGNVDIVQHEMKRAEGVAYNQQETKLGDLVEFKDGIQLYPAYPKNNEAGDYTAGGSNAEQFYWGPYVHTGTASNGLWNEDKLVGAVDKIVFVENTGASDVYFRTLIAFEQPEGVVIGEPSQGAHIMINETSSKKYGALGSRYVGKITVDGTDYALFEYVYADALLPGEWSHPSLLQVVMTHHATNKEMELLGDTYEILVLSQAMQTVNFEDVAPGAALDVAFGTVEEKAAEWFGGVWTEHIYTEELAPEMVVLTIDNLAEFKAFDVAVDNNGEFKGVKVANNDKVYVYLNTDLDLSTYAEFTGVGNGNGNSFNGVFNGKGHTISNWTVNTNWNYYMAFFRTTSGLDVKNVTFKNFKLGANTAKGTNFGVVIGAVGSGDVVVDNVTVQDCEINVQRTGGAVVGGMTEGHLTVTNCTIDNVTINNAGFDVESNRVAGVFLGKGWSAHDLEASGISVSNNAISNVSWYAQGVKQATVPEYTYQK